jgi:PilZ domain
MIAPPEDPFEESHPDFKDRQSHRTSISTRTTLTQQNWQSAEVFVRDLSTRGFMAECSEPVAIGSYVTLDLPGLGPVRAQVRWQIGSRMGGKFLHPVALDRCEWVAVKAAEAEPA